MNKELLTFIDSRISRGREKLIGHAVSVPYLTTMGSESVWVVDVLISSDAELLEATPFAESGRSVRDFINIGTPVELKRVKVGQFYVVGLSDRKRGDIVSKTYSLLGAGLGFTQGWRKNSEGNTETGNQNVVTPGTPATTTYSYTTSAIPYGDLDYGTTPYGATRTVRTP